MENGIKKPSKDMEEEFKFGLMEVNTKATGKMIKLTLEENFIMQMEIFMKENGLMIKPMDMESILM